MRLASMNDLDVAALEVGIEMIPTVEGLQAVLEYDKPILIDGDISTGGFF